MNHDYVHCLDYTEDCPEECFRAVLNRDLQKINPVKLITVHLVWGFLRGTDECLITRKEESYDPNKTV